LHFLYAFDTIRSKQTKPPVKKGQEKKEKKKEEPATKSTDQEEASSEANQSNPEFTMKLNDIFVQYIGEDYLQKLESIYVDEVKPGISIHNQL
jgi:hypothetical protein